MLRIRIVYVLFPLILIAGNPSKGIASAGFIEKNLSFDKSQISFKKVKGYDMVSIPNATHLNKIGYPSIPAVNIKLLIPPTATATRVEIISCKKEVIPGEFNIFPAQPPVRMSEYEENIPFVEPDPEVYDSKEPYPKELYSSPHTGTKCGYRIVDFSIYPIQYIPAEKKLVLIKELKVRLHYDYDMIPRKEITPKQKYIFGKAVRKMVMNPEDIEIWSPQVGQTKNRDENWEMVIIAPNNSSWIDSLQVLADWKTKKGVPCLVKNLQDIYNAYSGNNQWRIKQYINDMVPPDYGTIWILFGADHGTDATNSIPCRGVYAHSQPHYAWNMPCERYYEDLDNDWNHDGDDRYGENNDGPYGGQLDWYADVYVGRMFANNPTEAGKYVRRILKYEKDPPQYTTKALFYSDFLNHILETYENGYYTTDECAEEIPNNWFTGGHNLHPGYHYDQWDYNYPTVPVNNYPGDQAIIDSMNSGYGFICTASHGDTHFIMFDNPYHYNNIEISSDDIDNWLSPGDKVGIHTGICCLSGAFDATACIAEHIYDKGAIGGAWNSRFGWGDCAGTPQHMAHTYSSGIVWQFFVQAFSENKYHLGEAVALAKDHFIDKLNADGAWNWSLKTYNTFGDPELPMWTGANEPNPLVASYESTIPPELYNFNVTVKSSGNPVNSACVCCWCKIDRSMWVRGWTNSSGEVTLSINPDMGPDTMWVTATKSNYKPYEGFAFVFPKDLVLQNITVDIDESKTYQAANSITVAGDNTYFLIKGKGTNGGIVLMEAGRDSILLKPGFEAKMGCEFLARINPSLIESPPLSRGSSIPLASSSIEGTSLTGVPQSGKSEEVEKDTTQTLVEDTSKVIKEPIPTKFSCSQNIPNPVNTSTTIKYALPTYVKVSLTIYNVFGQEVRVLVNGYEAAGYKSVLWNGRNSYGASVPNGIYFYVLKAGNFTQKHKMVLLK